MAQIGGNEYRESSDNEPVQMNLKKVNLSYKGNDGKKSQHQCETPEKIRFTQFGKTLIWKIFKQKNKKKEQK